MNVMAAVQACCSALLLAFASITIGCATGESASATSPICSLDGPQLEQRLASIHRLVSEAGTGFRELPDGLILRFAPKTGVHEELVDLVQRERLCCSSIRWELTQASDGGALFLSCTGSRAAREFLSSRVLEGEELPRF